VYTYTNGGRERLNSLECRYLHTVSYATTTVDFLNLTENNARLVYCVLSKRDVIVSELFFFFVNKVA